MHISYQVMKDCVAASVKGAIIISAGFKETGEEGAKLEQEIMDIARDGNIRVVGPNCLGVMVSLWLRYWTYHVYIAKSISHLVYVLKHMIINKNPISGLNATFATSMAKKGNVAFISQSGAMCTSILDWSLQESPRLYFFVLCIRVFNMKPWWFECFVLPLCIFIWLSLKTNHMY